MIIEHSYLYHVGFTSVTKGRRTIFTINKESIKKMSITYDNIGEYYTPFLYDVYDEGELEYDIDDILEYFSTHEPEISQESFKLFKRSNTIKTILTTDKSAYGN